MPGFETHIVDLTETGSTVVVEVFIDWFLENITINVELKFPIRAKQISKKIDGVDRVSIKKVIHWDDVPNSYRSTIGESMISSIKSKIENAINPHS